VLLRIYSSSCLANMVRALMECLEQDDSIHIGWDLRLWPSSAEKEFWSSFRCVVHRVQYSSAAAQLHPRIDAHLSTWDSLKQSSADKLMLDVNNTCSFSPSSISIHRDQLLPGAAALLSCNLH
jgi:hypothetical protein